MLAMLLLLMQMLLLTQASRSLIPNWVLLLLETLSQGESQGDSRGDPPLSQHFGSISSSDAVVFCTAAEAKQGNRSVHKESRNDFLTVSLPAMAGSLVAI